MLKALKGVKGNCSKKMITLVTLATLAITMLATSAFAFTEPQAGEMLFEAYDLLFNTFLGGAAGLVIAGIMFLAGLILFAMGKGLLISFCCVLAAVLIVNVKDMVLGFGFSLNGAAAKVTAIAPQITQFLQ